MNRAERRRLAKKKIDHKDLKMIELDAGTKSGLTSHWINTAQQSP